MNLKIMSKLVFLILVVCQFSFLKADRTLTLIKEAGYPIKTYNVLTLDRYKLTLHRIPNRIVALHQNISTENSSQSDEPESNQSKPCVLLVHGLYTSAIEWVAGNSKKSLAFILADSGFDVWLYNARGTTVSMEHETLNATDKKYWDFSFHEIGYYDIPSVIDYILKSTGSQHISCVGHSQGSTAILVTLSTRPEYNNRFSSVHLMTPAAYMRNMTNMVYKLVSMSKDIESTMISMRMYAILYQDSKMQVFADAFCQSQPTFCSNFMYEVIGVDSGQMNTSAVINMITKEVVDNISIKQLVHYAQLIQHKKFRMYDYEELNTQYYSNPQPPEYDLANISVPINIIYGTKDLLVPPSDTEHLITKLKNVKNVIKLPWNHLDFVFGKDIDTMVNQPIIDFMKSVI